MKGSRTKYSSGFDPKTIPGCSLWLDAADRSTLTLSGSNITQWNDKSGLSNHFTNGGTTVAYQTNGAYFNGSALMQNTSLNGFQYGGTSLSTFAVVSVASVSGTGGIFAYGTISCGQTGYILYADTDSRLYGTLYCGALNVNTPLTLNTRTLIADVITFSGGASRAAWINGAPFATATATGSMTLTSNGVAYIGANGGGGQNLVGTINEVLVFNRALSTVERQQVEGYLARKWTLTQVSLLTSSHPYLSLGPVGFLPTSIPGCALWLDAADSSTLTLSGSNVTAWGDKSGNGRNAVGTTSSPTYNATGFNSRPTVTFSNSLLTSSGWALAPNRQFAWFIVVHLTSLANVWQRILISASVGYMNGYLGTYSTTSNILGIAGSSTVTAPIATGTLSPQLVTYLFGTSELSSNTSAVSVNGGTFSTLGGNTGEIGTNGLIIGADTGGAPVAERFLGHLSEVICYNSNVTQAQRLQIEGYLAWKWGTRTPSIAVPATHPYVSIPPTLRPFAPIDLTGCALWLDAADSSTLTLSGSNVTAWADKSGSNNHMSLSPFNVTNPTYSVATGVSFSNSALHTNAGIQTMCAFAVYNQSQTGAILSGTTAAAGTSRIYFGVWQGQYNLYNVPTASGTNTVNNNTSFSSSALFVGSYMFDGSNVTAFANGTSTSTTAFSGTPGTSTNVILGGDVFNGSITRLVFSMRELVLYTSVPTSSQRQQIEGYLARKWGLTSSIAVGHPYRFGLPPLTAEVTPRAISGCALWLDAADRSTLTLSGSTVTAWADKSGNGRNATQTVSAQRPTFASSAVSFTGASSTVLALPDNTIPSGNSAYSVYVVLTPRSSGVDVFLFSGNASTGQANGFFYTNVFWNYWWDTHINGGSATNGTRTLIEFVYTQNVAKYIYQTGALQSSVVASNRNSGTGNNYIGAEVLRGFYSTCDIHEILVYSADSTSAQRQQLEGYLAWKWGLQGTLPGGHPFRMLKP